MNNQIENKSANQKQPKPENIFDQSQNPINNAAQGAEQSIENNYTPKKRDEMSDIEILSWELGSTSRK